jgi:hypothetical protein
MAVTQSDEFILAQTTRALLSLRREQGITALVVNFDYTAASAVALCW